VQILEINIKIKGKNLRKTIQRKIMTKTTQREIMTKTTKMKKGITLIEIILAIVLVAIILGITIPKLMANSARAEIKQVISSDMQTIIQTAELWRKSNRGSSGSFTNLNSSLLVSRLPNTMGFSGGAILSSGLDTGNVTAGQETGAVYVLEWSFSPSVAGTTPTLGFSIGMDITRGAIDLGWDARLQAYALEVFSNSIADLTVTLAPGEPLSTAGYTTADYASTTTPSFNMQCNTLAGSQVICSNLRRISN